MLHFVMERFAHCGIPKIPHVSEDNCWDRGDHHEHPHHRQHPQYSPPASDDADAMRPQHCHQPVEAHQHDEVDGGVHVGQAQVEEDLAHHHLKHPLLHDQVDDEERSESHQGAVGKGEVDDEESGDRLLSSTCQDAPDDKDISREAQEKHEAQDESTHSGGRFVFHDSLISYQGGHCSVELRHVCNLSKGEHWSIIQVIDKYSYRATISLEQLSSDSVSENEKH